MSAVVIYGAGHLGRQMLHQVRNHDELDVLGYLDDTRKQGTDVVSGLQVLGTLDHLSSLGDVQVVFAIGYANMRQRQAALRRLVDTGTSLYSFVHPTAYVEPGAVVGAGSVLLAGAIVDQNVCTGAGCYFDIGVRVGEDSRLGEANYLSSGAALGGRVSVGDACFFGMDCTVTTDVAVGSNVFVNAKTLIARSVADNTRVVEMHRSKELPNPG